MATSASIHRSCRFYKYYSAESLLSTVSNSRCRFESRWPWLMEAGPTHHDHWSPALHIFLGTRNEGISRRLTCGVVDVQRFLHAYERSLACDSCLWIYLHSRFHKEHPLVLLYFSNPGAYIPSPLTPLWTLNQVPSSSLYRRYMKNNRPSTRSGCILRLTSKMTGGCSRNQEQTNMSAIFWCEK